MATLTSTGAVNLTSSTNWSPAQTPDTGDDLIIAAHTLTLDASMTLNTITFNSSASRLGFVAGTYTVQATDGWYRSHNTFTSGNLSAAAIAAGMDYTLVGQWIGGWSASQFTYAFVMTGGSLTLQTVGADPALPLIITTGLNTGFGIAAMTGGALTTIGLLDYRDSTNGGNYLVTLASATWTHNSVGINYGLTNANSMIVLATGASEVSWTGDYVSSHSSSGNVGIFGFSGTPTASITGNITVTGGPTGISQSAIVLISSASTATINITGKLASIGTLLTINNSNAATINWSGNFSLASNEQITCVVQSGGLLNLNDLVIANSSTIAMLGVNFGSIVAAGTTLITNMTTAALAACGGTRALDGKVITLESDPPTLPEAQDVAAGTSYGYSTSPQTGTGLILDPAVLTAATTVALANYETNGVASQNDLGNVTVGTNLDKTGYGLADNAITTAKIATGALTSAKFAAGAFNAVWTVATRTLTTVGDSAGVTTLLSRVTALLRTKVEDDAADVSIIGAVNAVENGNISANIYNYFTAGTRANAFKATIPAPTHVQPGPAIERSLADNKPIVFSFGGPGLNLVGTRSINNGSYSAVSGTISYLRTDGMFDLYTLSYNAADRPTSEGTVQYRFVSPGWTTGDPERFVILRVGAGDATIANQLAVINTVRDATAIQY